MGTHLDQRKRLLIAVPLGALAAVIAAFFCPWQLTVLVGWDVAAVFVAASVWTFITVLDAEATQRISTREDDSRGAAASRSAASRSPTGTVIVGIAINVVGNAIRG